MVVHALWIKPTDVRHVLLGSNDCSSLPVLSGKYYVHFIMVKKGFEQQIESSTGFNFELFRNTTLQTTEWQKHQ
jgi:hypothetical protein